MRIALVLLNRNEIEALPQILPEIPVDAVERVLCVDGGSTDGSAEMLVQWGFEVVPQAAMGRGEAFRIAFEILTDDVDAVIFFSTDGNEDPSDISLFREHLEAGADMVIASRMVVGAKNEEDDQVIRLRKWANLAFNHLAYAFWGRGQRRITDAINGYRAIRVDAWNALLPDGTGYTIEYQLSIRSYKRKLIVTEFPTTEGSRIGGTSGANSVRTGLRFLRLLIREIRSGRP